MTLPTFPYDERAICPMCGHFNAMLVIGFTVDGKSHMQCRDCKYEAVAVVKENNNDAR